MLGLVVVIVGMASIFLDDPSDNLKKELDSKDTEISRLLDQVCVPHFNSSC